MIEKHSLSLARNILATLPLLFCLATPAPAEDALTAPDCPSGGTCMVRCEPDGTCRVLSSTVMRVDGSTSTNTLSSDETITLGTSTGIGIATDVVTNPSDLDFVKAAAVIRWHARKEWGAVRSALERAATFMDVCARQGEPSYLTAQGTVGLNCK